MTTPRQEPPCTGRWLIHAAIMCVASLAAVTSVLGLLVVDQLGKLTGPTTWGALAILAGSTTGAASGLLACFPGSAAANRARAAILRLGLAGSSVLAALTVLELGLVLAVHLEDRPVRYHLPPELQFENLSAYGVHRAWKWHGHLHLSWTAEWQFRRVRDFPPRHPDQCRVMVVGDSLTYGEGVAAGAAYPARLAQLLSEQTPVEVLNLGERGAQSERIADILEHWLPELAPDLVVYGVCFNDLLPTSESQREADDSFAIPMPDAAKSFLLERTLLTPLAADLYNRSLITIGLRTSFFGQIENRLDGLLPDFEENLRRMNRSVVTAGLPPLVVTVLDQRPRAGGSGAQLAALIEQRARAIGADVVPSASYIDRHDGRDLSVSRWEGHPNEEAHRLFAARLAAAVRRALNTTGCGTPPRS